MSKFQCLLFDADNTLFDSTSAFPAAIVSSFKAIGRTVDDDLLERYESINSGFWRQYEEGSITLDEIKQRRFREILTFLEIDHDPGNFNRLYLEKLVEETHLYPSTEELLKELSETHRMCIITNGMREAQRPRLRKTGIDHYFESIIVSDEVGFSKPEPEYFDVLMKSLSDPPNKNKMLVIGDSLTSDIAGGLNYGLPTCWISHGKVNPNKEVQPDYVIEKVSDLRKILQ